MLGPLAAELGGARTLAVDLSDAAAVNRLVADVGDVDILVANAALPGSGRLESFTIDEIDRALDVNLRAPIVLAHALAPVMVKRGRGHLLFMSSLSGKSATPGTAIYNATSRPARLRRWPYAPTCAPAAWAFPRVFPGFIRDAGMFAEAGVKLPPGVGTASPEDVARAVLSAIERNRAEVDVAPLSVRAGATFAGIAPELASKVARRLGSENIAREMEVGQRAKR